ncbi:MAG: DNA gyrase inhibitor YacG [Pseudomonadota bacterium]
MTTRKDTSQDAATRRPCPICGKPASTEYKPFCSRRCADVDLNRWLSGSYAIPVTEEDDEDGDQAFPASPEEPERGR